MLIEIIAKVEIPTKW